MAVTFKKNKWYYFTLVLVLSVVLYYGFPPIFDSSILRMGLLFILNPLYSIVSCMLYTAKFGMQSSLPLSLGMLFLPSALLFYGRVFCYYSVFYGAAALAGCCIGYPIYKRYQ